MTNTIDPVAGSYAIETLTNEIEHGAVAYIEKIDAMGGMLRAIENFDSLQRYFQLGVSFVGTTVNRHRIELYVLDAAGVIERSVSRLQWDRQYVMDLVSAMAHGS